MIFQNFCVLSQACRGFLAIVFVGLATTPAWAQRVSNSDENDAQPIQWKIKCLAIDRNEGIDVADFDKDGLVDIVAGRNWYAAPDFVARPVRDVADWNGYVESNGDYAMDVDGDGWTDVIAGSFLPTEVHWFKNPGKNALMKGQQWPKNLLVDTKQSQNEGQLLYDINKDGKPEWIVNSWVKRVPLNVWQFTKSEGRPTLSKVTIGKDFNGHGLAVGDLNGDGHEDIMVGTGWYENPGSKELTTNWKYHPDWDEHASVPCLIRDWNGDGKNDLIIGNGHNYGLFLWTQTGIAESGKIEWKKTLIDKQYSQPHSLHLADLDGDGEPELITGKRLEAHNGGDPGGKEMPCLYYYKWDEDSMSFNRFTIDEGHVGTGLQIRTADFDSDGKIDIAVAGKSGTYLLMNLGKKDEPAKRESK